MGCWTKDFSVCWTEKLFDNPFNHLCATYSSRNETVSMSWYEPEVRLDGGVLERTLPAFDQGESRKEIQP